MTTPYGCGGVVVGVPMLCAIHILRDFAICYIELKMNCYVLSKIDFHAMCCAEMPVIYVMSILQLFANRFA